MSLLEAGFLFDHWQTLDGWRPLGYRAAGASRRGDPAAAPRFHRPTEAAGPTHTHPSALGGEVGHVVSLVIGNFSFFRLN